MIVKLGLFLFKMVTIQQVCWPYSIGRLVGASLLAAAAFELVLPWLSEDVRNPSRRLGVPPKRVARPSTDPSFAVDNGRSGTQDDHEPTDARPNISPRTSSSHVQVRGWRGTASGWDWTVSLLLLALHYLILGAASRYGALCAVPHDETWSRR